MNVNPEREVVCGQSVLTLPPFDKFASACWEGKKSGIPSVAAKLGVVINVFECVNGK